MKRRSMLIASAIIVSIAMIAVASYSVWTHTFETEVKEPFDVTVIEEFTNPMYPGLGTNAIYEVHNSGGAPLSATAIWPASSPDNKIAIYSTIYYIDDEGTKLDDITRVDYDGTETFTLYTDGYAPTGKSSYARVFVSVLVSADAPPGYVNVPVEFLRG